MGGLAVLWGDRGWAAAALIFSQTPLPALHFSTVRRNGTRVWSLILRIIFIILSIFKTFNHWLSTIAKAYHAILEILFRTYLMIDVCNVPYNISSWKTEKCAKSNKGLRNRPKCFCNFETINGTIQFQHYIVPFSAITYEYKVHNRNHAYTQLGYLI